MRLLTEEQKHWVEVIGDFCKKEIEPIMLDWDKVVDPSKAIPFEPYAKAFKLGLNSFEIPKEYGGNKVDLATAEVMYEEMGYYDGNFASVMQTTNLALKPILIGGTPEQVQYFSKHILEGKGYAAFALTEPQSGSDASNVKTTAVKDGDEWVINGSKIFTTNSGFADTCIVFALTDRSVPAAKGMTAFIVDLKGTPGVTISDNIERMGIRAASNCIVSYDNVRVGADRVLGQVGKGFKIAMGALDCGRIGIAAQAVGIAQGALNEAIKYAKERKQFGKSIVSFQNSQFKIAEMQTKIDAARLMTWRAAIAEDNHEVFGPLAAMAKLMASDVAVEVTRFAVQLMGGYGFCREYPVERMYRDAKITEIYEGTSEVLKMVISGSMKLK